MNPQIIIGIIVMGLLLTPLTQIIYNRIIHKRIINQVNDDFQQLLDENNHKLEYYHIDDFMIRNSDVVDDIEITLDENNNMVYTLKFKDWV